MGNTHLGDTKQVMRPPVIYGASSVKEFPNVTWMASDPQKLTAGEEYLRNAKQAVQLSTLERIMNAESVYFTLRTLSPGLSYAEVRNYDTGRLARHCMELVITDRLSLRSPKVLDGFSLGDGFTLEALSEDKDGCITHCHKAIGIGREIIVVKYSLFKSGGGGRCSFSYRLTKGEETERPVYRSVEMRIDNIDDVRGNRSVARVIFGRQLPTGKSTYATDSFEFVFGEDAKLVKVVGLSQSNFYNHDWRSVRLQAAMRKGAGRPVEHTPDWQVTPWLMHEFLREFNVQRQCQPASILARLIDSAKKGTIVVADRNLIFG